MTLADFWEKRIFPRYRGPEARAHLVCLRKSEEIDEARKGGTKKLG